MPEKIRKKKFKFKKKQKATSISNDEVDFHLMEKKQTQQAKDILRKQSEFFFHHGLDDFNSNQTERWAEVQNTIKDKARFKTQEIYRVRQNFTTTTQYVDSQIKSLKDQESLFNSPEKAEEKSVKKRYESSIKKKQTQHKQLVNMHIICPENIRYNVSPLKLKNQKVRSKFSSKDHDNTKLTSTKINNFYERAQINEIRGRKDVDMKKTFFPLGGGGGALNLYIQKKNLNKRLNWTKNKNNELKKIQHQREQSMFQKQYEKIKKVINCEYEFKNLQTLQLQSPIRIKKI